MGKLEKETYDNLDDSQKVAYLEKACKEQADQLVAARKEMDIIEKVAEGRDELVAALHHIIEVQGKHIDDLRTVLSERKR